MKRERWERVSQLDSSGDAGMKSRRRVNSNVRPLSLSGAVVCYSYDCFGDSYAKPAEVILGIHHRYGGNCGRGFNGRAGGVYVWGRC